MQTDTMNQVAQKMSATPIVDGLPSIPGNGGNGATGTTGFDGILNNTQGFNGTSEDLAYYFQLQAEVARETLMWQTLSNMLKARQDASLNSVRNMRN